MRKTIIAFTTATALAFAGMVAVITPATADTRTTITMPRRPIPVVCKFYTFNQQSTSATATLRTIINVCVGRPVCESRSLFTADGQFIQLSTTCPAVPRR